MFCGKCGKQIEDNAKFCPYCGAVSGRGAAGTGTGAAPVQKIQPVASGSATGTETGKCPGNSEGKVRKIENRAGNRSHCVHWRDSCGGMEIWTGFTGGDGDGGNCCIGREYGR